MKHAEGCFENSPAIDGWVHGSATSPVPSGTKEIVGRPLRDFEIRVALFPAMNGWAIFIRPAATKAMWCSTRSTVAAQPFTAAPAKVIPIRVQVEPVISTGL